MSTPELIDRAEQLAAHARSLLAEAVEAADAYERLCWEDTLLENREANEDTPEERRFFDAMHDAHAALAVARLKLGDGDGMRDLPATEWVESKFPEVPEYRRLRDQEAERIQNWIRMGSGLDGQ